MGGGVVVVMGGKGVECGGVGVMGEWGPVMQDRIQLNYPTPTPS